MSRIGPILVAVLGSTGCFYVDPINQRPALDIRTASDDTVFRGDRVELRAVAQDPDGHIVGFRWRAQACTEISQADGCDPVPFASSLIESFGFDVPTLRVPSGVPVESIRVVLEGTDELGASAKPSQELVIPLGNRAPNLMLDKDSRYKYVARTPIGVFALVGDDDDGPAALAPLVWEVFAPAQVTHTLTDRVVEQDPEDPDHVAFGKTFVADAAGDWQIRVTATDPLANTTTEMITVTVMEDTPPCLAQLQPAAPTGGALLPLTEPTLFRVPVVIDDLDLYPPVPADEVLGTTTFRWSLKPPGQPAHQAIPGAVGNSYAIDPASYTPGDLVELRVEIFDQEPEAIPCNDSEQTCSVNVNSGCLQRQTWRMEIR